MMYIPYPDAIAALKEAACCVFDVGVEDRETGLQWLQERGLVSTQPHYFYERQYALTEAGYSLCELGFETVHRPLPSWLPADIRKAA